MPSTTRSRRTTRPAAEAPTLLPRSGFLRGDRDRTHRQSHVLAALAVAGLVGEVDPEVYPRAIQEDGTVSDRVLRDTMTPERHRVLVCFAEGQSYTETARSLNLSVSTVKSHAGAIYDRMGVSDDDPVKPKVGCVVNAVRWGFLPAPADAEGTGWLAGMADS